MCLQKADLNSLPKACLICLPKVDMMCLAKGNIIWYFHGWFDMYSKEDIICIAKGGFGMLSTAYLIMYNKGNKIFLARVDLICLSKADLICLSKADLIYLQMCAAAGWTSLTKLGRVTVQMKTSCLFIHRMDKFDKARKSHGTDEDVLLVYTQGEIVGL